MKVRLLLFSIKIISENFHNFRLKKPSTEIDNMKNKKKMKLFKILS